MGIALWGARGRCCALRVGSKEFRWWATLLGVCLVGTGPTCAGLPPPAPTSPTADPFRPLHFPCSFSAPKAAPYSGHVFARAGAVALRHGRGRGAVVFPRRRVAWFRATVRCAKLFSGGAARPPRLRPTAAPLRFLCSPAPSRLVSRFT